MSKSRKSVLGSCQLPENSDREMGKVLVKGVAVANGLADQPGETLGFIRIFQVLVRMSILGSPSKKM